ncbi:GTPase HflX [Candidatus Saganbacteria bacterium]|nr:GTPase HflX [Candidatus Saganbacteria bacterium]
MEKAILVSVKLKSERISLDESLNELKQLARTADAFVLDVLTQNRERPDVKYFLGEGKVSELKELCEKKEADLIIFDHDIHASQTRNLENFLGIKVINRTELILDIFAQHAHSREGKLQVALAQAEYRLTRLSGHGIELSRLGGGIGTRGPGETKLEVDRRRINAEISKLKHELKKVSESRKLLRQKRKSSEIKTISLIGYTNAGKSTLMNMLSKSNLLTQDKLFATLDPVTRRIYLPSGKVALLTDTVGFIRKLPHNLVSAFHATLEETIEADVLLHVVDASSPYKEDQMEAVYDVLEELKIYSKPIITVFNKIDKLENLAALKKFAEKFKPYSFISALDKESQTELITLLDEQISH